MPSKAIRRLTLFVTFVLLMLAPPTADLRASSGPGLAQPTQVRRIYVPAIRRPPITNSVRFAVIGDFGSDSQPEADVASLLKSWTPYFVVTVGDNNYPNGAAATIDQNIGKYYYQFISPYTGQYGIGSTTNLLFPVMGNHDWDSSKGKPYLTYFALPGNERYYDIAIGPVRVFALDSDEREPDGATADSKQGQWLRATMSASRSCWDIVVAHHSPYSSGQHQGSSPWMQWPFRAWGADLVLSGHDHLYERLLVGGLPYIVNGLGGESLHPFGTTVAGSQVRYNADYGALLVDANKSQLLLRFYSRAGHLIDAYTLRKTCA